MYCKLRYVNRRKGRVDFTLSLLSIAPAKCQYQSSGIL